MPPPPRWLRPWGGGGAAAPCLLPLLRKYYIMNWPHVRSHEKKRHAASQLRRAARRPHDFSCMHAYIIVALNTNFSKQWNCREFYLAVHRRLAMLRDLKYFMFNPSRHETCGKAGLLGAWWVVNPKFCFVQKISGFPLLGYGTAYSTCILRSYVSALAS